MRESAPPHSSNAMYPLLQSAHSSFQVDRLLCTCCTRCSFKLHFVYSSFSSPDEFEILLHSSTSSSSISSTSRNALKTKPVSSIVIQYTLSRSFIHIGEHGSTTAASVAVTTIRPLPFSLALSLALIYPFDGVDNHFTNRYGVPSK